CTSIPPPLAGGGKSFRAQQETIWGRGSHHPLPAHSLTRIALPSPVEGEGEACASGLYCPSESNARWKRPACDFSAFARVSNQSAISSKPSERAVLAMPGYMSVYSWVSPAI